MKGLSASLLLAVLVLVSLLSATRTVSAATQAVAGWVETPIEVAPYLLVKAVESKSGMTARTTKLDSTRTFTFAGLPASVDRIEVVSQIPAHLFTLQPQASVLSAPIPASSESAVALRVSVTPVQAVSRSANEESKGSVGTAVMAVVVLVAMWFGRSQIVSYLDLPGLRMPKQKKVMVPR